jgi:hypothetical protein
MSSSTNKFKVGVKEMKEEIPSKIVDIAENASTSSSKNVPTTANTSDPSLLEQTKSYAAAATDAATKKAVETPTSSTTTSSSSIDPPEKEKKQYDTTISMSADTKSIYLDTKASTEKLVGKMTASADEANTDVPTKPASVATAGAPESTKKDEDILAKVEHKAEKLADKIIGSIDKLLHKSKKSETATTTTSANKTATTSSGEEKVEEDNEGATTQSAGQSTDTTPEKKSHHTWQESLGKKIHDVSEAILHPSKKVKKGASSSDTSDTASKAEEGSKTI